MDLAEEPRLDCAGSGKPKMVLEKGKEESTIRYGGWETDKRLESPLQDGYPDESV